MTLRFVKTSILTSDDGIDFGKEVAVESEEVLRTRAAAEAASNKPLFQQLADIRDRKKEEYDENTKKLFAPPKGLDEEDIEFFNDLDDAKTRVANIYKREEDRELEAFREARRIEMLKDSTEVHHAPINFLPQKKIEQPMNSGITLKAKRKVCSNGEKESVRKVAQKQNDIEGTSSACTAAKHHEEQKLSLGTKTIEKTKEISDSNSNKSTVKANTVSLFAEYDSD